MKRLIVILAIAGIVLAGCGRREELESAGDNGAKDASLTGKGKANSSVKPAADQVLLEDPAGDVVVDAAVHHAGHALAGDLHERIGEGVAETAHAAHLDPEAESADPLLEDGADRFGAGGDVLETAVDNGMG